MNRILLEAADFTQSDTVVLRDHRAAHIRQVLRASPGDRLKVGLLGGDCGDGELLDIGDTGATLRVSLHRSPPAKLPLTLLLALPRPKAARRIIRAATELGVRDIVLLNSYRVEKSYWQSPLVDDSRLVAAMREGLEQSGDTVLPGLTRARLFKPFVEDQLPSLLADKTGLLAHPHSACSQPQARGETVLAVGPEGGFIPYEVEKLAQAGFQPFSLGERILKVETALPTLIGKLWY